MKQLAVQDLCALMGSHPETLLLDVREPWELEQAVIRLPGAAFRHIPMGLVPHHLAELDRAQPIVCLCHHGVRSQHVAAFLSRQGYAQVYNLAGGIDAWSTDVDPAVPRY
jgi:rhodanese-related sulfurtransferase